ncbi:MAG: hypothetical protein AB4080_24425 [Trichodesmium sp.]
MQNYTAIIFSFFLLLGNTPSTEALTMGNEIEYSSTFYRHGSGKTRVKNDSPKRKRGIRAFVNTICTSESEEKKFRCHRGSGR